ncbi:hypothetical protein DL771_008755 [Monosporascus sp. 5C6A]|nr:hypothetical protein DL771_008755 [Monosporascus sp. 5C6A]
MSLSRRTSLHAREVIQKAFKELERAVAVPDARRFRDMTIHDVQKACESIENELGARGLLRNMGRLQPLLKGLECYGKAVKTLCQGTPYLPWIWAPIVVILRIGSDCIAAFEILIKAYARIGKSLGRFEKLRNAFAGNPGFQEIVAIFYRDIVKFHECAYKFVTANGWRIFFRTTWGRFDRHFSVILDNLDQHGELIDKEANARNIVETQALLKQFEADRNESLEKVQEEEKAEIAKQYQAILARLQINESDQNSIWETLVGALRAGPECTCAWVLKHEKMASWLSEKGDTRSLWLQGSAGTGKSVIAAHLAKFRSLDNHIVIRHFCDDLYDSSTKYDQILKSIIRQLLEKSDDSTAYAYKALVIERKSLTTSTLETIIQELVSILSGSAQERQLMWIILDGVDACEAASLARCIALMDLIALKDCALGTAACKVLFTSRCDPPKKQARRRPLVLLGKENSHLQASIQLYAVHRLHSPLISDRLSQLGVGTDDITDLGHKIAAKADGMFLYARIIVDYISKQLFRTSEDLRGAIQELPPELKGFYQKILSNIISHLNPASTESIQCVLHWIAFSKSPLKQLEILSAITFCKGMTEIERLVPTFFLQDCSALLEEKCDKTIGFIHASVKEFLLDPESPISITQEEAQRQHVLGILACLASAARHFGQPGNEPNTRLRVVKGVFAFLNYASNHWTECVVSYAETCSRNGVYDTRFSEAIDRLANSLCRLATLPDAIVPNSQFRDPPLQALQNFPSIRPFVKMALQFESQEAIDKVFVENGQGTSTQTGPFIDPVSTLLQKYRDAVRWLLRQDYYPGVSRDDFELFRAQTQTSLFTCRLPLCPSASIGHETEAELRAHELEHTKGFPCRVGGCRYPPFRSAQLLENHFKRHHHQVLPKRNLRRVGEFRHKARDVRVDSARIAPGTAALYKMTTFPRESLIPDGGQVPSPPRLQRQSPSRLPLGEEYSGAVNIKTAEQMRPNAINMPPPGGRPHPVAGKAP